jgi:hypothetical protein
MDYFQLERKAQDKRCIRMKKSKSNFKYYLVGFFILLILSVLIYGSIKLFKQQTFVSNVGQCPANNICTATPILDCSTPQNNVRIDLRCGDNWFAWDSDGLGLKYYAKVSGTVQHVNTNPIICCGTRCVYSGIGGNAYPTTRQGTYSTEGDLYSISASPDQKLLQTTNLGTYAGIDYSQREHSSTGSAYSCSNQILINGKVVDTISYNSPTPNSAIRGNTYTLKAGDTITYNGQIDFTATKIPNNNCSSPLGPIASGNSVCSGNTLYQCTQSVGQDAVLSSPIDCTSQTKICIASSPTQAGCFYPQKCIGTPIGDMNLGQRACINGNTQSIYCTTDSTGKPTPITTSCQVDQPCISSTNLCTYPQYCTFSGYGNLNVNTKACLGTILLSCTGNSNSKPSRMSTDCAASGQKCSSADLACENPYTVSVSINGITDPASTSAISIGGGTQLTVLYKMAENIYTRRDLRVTLMDEAETTTISSVTKNDFTNQQLSIQIATPTSPGYYHLKVYMQHPDGDVSKTYLIHTTSPLAVTVASDNPDQFDNKDILVYALITQGGSSITPANYEFSATFNGQTVNYIGSPDHPTTGKYVVHYQVKGTGSLRVRARAINTGDADWGAWSDYYEINVHQAIISIVSDFKTDIDPGSYTFTFQTKDSGNNLVETSNIVTYGTSGNAALDNKPLSVSGSGGSYSFQVTFDTGTVYYIYVSSHSNTLGDVQLNGGHGVPVNVYKHGTPNTQPNYLLYGIVAIVILGFGAVMYFVFRKKKGGKR